MAFLHLPAKSDFFDTLPIFTEKFVAVIASGNGQAKHEMPMRELLKATLISLPHDQVRALRIQLEGWFRKLKTIPPIQEVRDKQTLLSLVAAGIGVAVVPEHVKASAGSHDVSFLALPELKDDLQLGAMWRKDNDSPVLRAFLDVLRDRLSLIPSPAYP